jgi:hypothetical protein
LGKRVEETMLKLAPRPDELYVVWMSPLPSQGVFPLKNLKSLLNGMNIVALSWPQRTPFFYEMLDRFQIRDIVRALSERNDVYLVTLPFLLPYLERFIKEHHNYTVRFRIHFQHDLITVYKVEKQTS